MEDLDCLELREIAEILEDSFVRGQGTIGFGKANLLSILSNTSVLNHG